MVNKEVDQTTRMERIKIQGGINDENHVEERL